MGRDMVFPVCRLVYTQGTGVGSSSRRRREPISENARVSALLYGFLAAFFWGTHSVIVRFLTSDMHGITIATIRLYLAALVLFAIMKARGHRIGVPLSDRDLLLAIAATAINYAFFHIGLEHTSASNAMMLENTAPFFVLVFLALFVRKPISLTETIATLIAMAGVFLTVRRDLAIGGESIYGDVLELLAGATWAVFIMASSRAMAKSATTMERVNFLFNVFIFSAVLLTPAALFFPLQFSAEDGVLLILLAVFPTAVAYYLWYEAAARVSTVSAALLFTLSVVFTFINAYLFLGEDLHPDLLIGGALIVLGVIVSKVGSREA